MILLTGAAGYIGSHIFHEFKTKKIKILGIDNFCTKNINNKYTNKILNVDINDDFKIEKLIKKYEINTVIHAAAYSHPLESLKYPKKYKVNNIIKTKNFIKTCTKNKIQNFIFFSSSNVYTEKKYGPYKESNKKKPKNYYGKTKLFIEKILTKNRKQFKSLIILRLFNVVGYYPKFKYHENKYKFKRIFNIFQNEINNNKEFKLYYYLKKNKVVFPERDFIHIKDLNLLLLKIFHKIKKIPKKNFYNVGSGEPTNIKKLINIYENENKIKIKYKLKKINKIELKSVFADIKKIKLDFSWLPKSNIKSIINSYI